MRQSPLRTLSATVVLLATAGPALAHKMMLVATLDGDRVRVEAFHDDDTPAEGATVTVRTGDDPPVAEGKTDEKGVWSFARPAPGRYTVRASSVGHTASKGLTIPADTSAEPAADQPREEQTRTPWRNVLIGLGLIAGACVIVLLVRKRGSAPVPLGP